MELDEDLVELLRFPSRASARVHRDPSAVLDRAEMHGVGALAFELLRELGIQLPPGLETKLGMCAVARELDHSAHLAILQQIDALFSAAGLEGIALKGALLAERLYPVPSWRATSDIDLMVAEGDLERAVEALTPLGYVAATGRDELRFRREHHHIHLHSASAPPLELHFHAYRGLGRTLRSEPLIERRERVALLGHGAVGVLMPADELVYLSAHAAAHRFIRLGWLYDIRLLVERMSPDELLSAARHARRSGYARALAFTARLLREIFGVSSATLEPLGILDPMRSWILERVVGEPPAPLRRSATRFVYSTALCDSSASAVRYAAGALLGRARHQLDA